MSAYDVLKPTVVTESDVSVRNCVIGVENDTDVVDHNDEDFVTSRSHDTLLGNVEMLSVSKILH